MPYWKKEINPRHRLLRIKEIEKEGKRRRKKIRRRKKKGKRRQRKRSGGRKALKGKPRNNPT